MSQVGVFGFYTWLWPLSYVSPGKLQLMAQVFQFLPHTWKTLNSQFPASAPPTTLAIVDIWKVNQPIEAVSNN